MREILSLLNDPYPLVMTTVLRYMRQKAAREENSRFLDSDSSKGELEYSILSEIASFQGMNRSSLLCACGKLRLKKVRQYLKGEAVAI